ncbi:hypothetical protein EKG40_11120 [Pseudomonas moorei]|nr:hypothetical protein EKG40_11120 [Pseudomonas moorei]
MIISNKRILQKKYSSWWWFVAFFSTGLAMSFILFFLPAGGVSLVVDLNSKAADTSQVFFSETGAYSESNSSRNNISPGRNVLNFPLGGSCSSIRWDPLNSGGSIEVNDIYVSIFGVRLDVDKISLNPLSDIEKITSVEGKFFVEMKAGVSDPKLDVGLDFNEIYRWHVFFSALFGFAIAIIVFGVLLHYFKNRSKYALDYFDFSLDCLFSKIRKEGFNFREVGVLIVIGSILYVYFLSTFSFSIDDEAAALRTDPSDWVSQGRWFVYLVERFVFPQPSIPFAPYIFLVVSLSVSYALILKAHGYATNWKTYALYPIFCAYPTWWFIAEFYSNIPAIGFGVFFISLSVYLVFSDADEDQSIGVCSRRNFFVVVLIACAIAAYQSLLLLFVCVVFGVLLVRCLQSGDTDRAQFKYVVRVLSKVFLLVLFALLFYVALNFLAQRIIAADSGYVGGFINYNATLRDPLGVFFLVFHEMFLIYSGSSYWYGASIYISGVVILLAAFSALSFGLLKTTIRLFLLAGVLITPFALHFISGGVALPMRAMMAVAYVGWLSSSILVCNKRSSFFLVGAIIVGLYQIQIFSITSQYMTSATITQSHDRMLAADIYRRIGELSNNFDRNSPLKIDVYGKKTLTTVYAKGLSSAMQGSFFSWDGGNVHRMINYMKVMGYENISVLGSAERIAMTPFFNEMPVWPAAGSVRKIDDCYLVRLSNEPDPTHEKFSQ